LAPWHNKAVEQAPRAWPSGRSLGLTTENFLTADYADIADDIGYPCHEAITFIPPWNFQLGRIYPLASWPIPLSSQVIPLASEAVPVVEQVIPVMEQAVPVVEQVIPVIARS